MARTVARTDGPIRRGAHRDAQRARTDIQSGDVARIVTRNERVRTFRVEAWRATSAHKRVVVFVENRNRREGIGNSKETDADNNMY